MQLTRRDFLKTTGAVTLGFAGLQTLFTRTGNASPPAASIAEGYGPLMRDPAGILDLPKGFRYTVVSRKGEVMDDGFRVPGKHDGMATFSRPDGLTVVVRNHELDHDDVDLGPFEDGNALPAGFDRGLLYDTIHGRGCPGGTTTLLFDTKSQTLRGHKLSLTGTLRNCAGGPTPWNTWVTCEETVARAGGGLGLDHGYNFEVPGDYDAGLAAPVPLKDMGRFNHEAMAVDPASGVTYQTEDRHDGLLYRFLPNEPGDLAKGGRLQALVVRRRPFCDTRNWDHQAVARGERLEVAWMDLDGIDAPDDDLRFRGYNAGAARFARGEGMWAGTDGIYFACTNGGTAKKGQVWRYVPSPNEGTPGEADAPATLELFVEPNDGGILDNADNLTVAPWGDVVVCEDGSGEQYVVGITPEGGIYRFAHNAVSDSELAGATFSPDGSTLFVNIQHDGLTVAITGPWGDRVA